MRLITLAAALLVLTAAAWCLRAGHNAAELLGTLLGAT